MKKLLPLCLFLAILSQVSAEPLTHITGRMYSTGGPHAADGNSFASVLYNPAYFAFAEDQVLFSDTGIGFSGVNNQVKDLVQEGDYLGLIPLWEGTYLKADVSGPINSGFIKNKAGFRVYNELDLLSFTSNMVVSSAVRLNDQLVFQGGGGGRLPLPAAWKGEASWGVLGKFFIEWEYLYYEDILKFLYSLTEPSLFIDNPMNLKSGAGVDLGFLHVVSGRFSYGLTIHDAFTPYGDFIYSSLDDYGQSLGYSHTEFGMKPVNVSVGMKYSPDLFRNRKWIGPWDIFLDYRDIFNFAYDDPVNPVLNIGIGSELKMLRILDIRTGFHEGLLSFGTAVNLKFLKIGISFYGNELTGEPGVYSVYTTKLNIEFHK
ncbi:MAG: hypothetical protein PQJ58_20040 [Spirochaetales bacterium]|nr:hypothetical protein [Spirochaetales bacterium]